MRKICILIFLIYITVSEANASLLDSIIKSNQNVIGLLPSKSKNINGIAIGIVGSEVYCDYKTSKISNGINLQIGQGILLLPMLFYDMSNLNSKYKIYNDSILLSIDTSYYKAKHNGLIYAILGSGTDIINGISVSNFYSSHKKINGFNISLLGVTYYKTNGISISLINKGIQTNGLQIGLFNSSVMLKGLQIGLWNKNKKRALPLINW
jgi:hypothetical protein